MKRPVVLLGCRARVAVPLARSLSRQGIPVILAYNPLRDFTIVPSRCIYRNVSLPLPRSGDKAGRMLHDLVGRYDADMLIPASDWDLRALAPHRETLRPQAIVAAPAPRTIDRILSKIKTLEIASRLGIPIAATWFTDDHIPGKSVDHPLAFPLVAKARDRSETLPALIQLCYLPDTSSLNAALEEQPALLRYALLQEYLPGQDVHLAMLMHDGSAVATFQCRALRTSMQFVGVSVVTCSEPVDPLLADYATRILRELAWEGVAEIDFRHDPRTGKVNLLEVNGRFWGSLDAAVHAGVDFPFYLWQIAHGQMPKVVRDYPGGLRTRHLRGDLARAGRILLRANDNRGAYAGNRWYPAWELVREFGMASRDSIWSISDPLPAVWDIVGPLADRMTRRIRFRPA